MSGRLAGWLRWRWRGLFGRRAREVELDREMQFHMDMLMRENIAAGMSPGDAKLAAQRDFGGRAQYQEECRDTWRPALVSGLLGDFSFAARSLRRSPGFTAVAVLTLALGIGVNVVIFSFVRDTVLQPARRDRALNLVSLYNVRAGADRQFRYFSYPEFQALKESREVFADVAAVRFQEVAIGREQELQRRFVGLVSQNYFSLLEVRPAQGRFFTAEESQPNASIPVMVASHALWERLGRPANFLGSTLRVGDRTYTVVGMTPPGFLGLHVSIGPDAWLPFGEARQTGGADLLNHTDARLSLVARLPAGLAAASTGARLESAEHRLNALPPVDQRGARRLIAAAPSRSDLGNVSPDSEAPLGLFGAMGLGLSLLVLLLACLNLANLLLARGVSRHKEIAIRLALGASRWRIVRGLLAEGLLLALLGGALSLLLGKWNGLLLTRWAQEAFAAGKFAVKAAPFLDWPLVLAALGFCLIATLGFSLWPALRITRAELYPDLKQIASGPPAAASGRRRTLALGDLPLLAQIALSLALLFSAVLFVRAAHHARTLDLGFNPERQLTAQLDYKLGKVEEKIMPRRQQALLASTAELPGVTAAALSSSVPYNFDLPFRRVRAAPGDAATPADPKDAGRHAGHTAVTRGYLGLMGIALLAGRDFSPEESEGSSEHRVAIIDDTLARALFGAADPIGRRILLEGKSNEGRMIEVVGLVRSPRNDVFGPVPMRLYRPLGQSASSDIYLHVQVADPLALAGTLRVHLRAVAPEVPVLMVRPFSDFVDKNINVLLVRIVGAIFGASGIIALILAVVGVYGVKAHAIARRTREIGVRMALGADQRDIMGLILRQGLIQAGTGVLGGLVLAVAVGFGLSSMLYRVKPFDLPSLLGCSVLLGGALLLACWIPARRAARVDPLVAIRAE